MSTHEFFFMEKKAGFETKTKFELLEFPMELKFWSPPNLTVIGIAMPGRKEKSKP